MLLKMPGVNTRNVHSIMNAVPNMAALASLPLDRLTAIMGSAPNAELLHRFIHTGGAGSAPDPAGGARGAGGGGGKQAGARPRHKRLPLKKTNVK